MGHIGGGLPSALSLAPLFGAILKMAGQHGTYRNVDWNVKERNKFEPGGEWEEGAKAKRKLYYV